MQSNEFEKMFGDFLECNEYDQAQNAVFTLTRKSFEAGWEAAGGEPPMPHRLLEIVHRRSKKD